MKVFELVLTGNPMYDGVDTISIVSEPAIEEDFIALKKWQKQALEVAAPLKLNVQDKDKRLLVGAALIPNKPIYRNEDKEEFYIFFSKDTIREASQLFMQKGYQNSASLEHEKRVKGATIVESWIIEDPEQDKSNLYNLSLPKGSWVVSMKVNNDDVWNEYVKTGKVKGFSIEGYFIPKSKADKLSKDADKANRPTLRRQIR